MEDEWRELARTVPGTLMFIGFTSAEYVRSIELANRKLFARVNLVRRIRRGADDMNIAIDAFVDPDPVGVLPTKILDRALRAVKFRRAHHGKARRVLHLCISHLGLQPGVRIRSWEGDYVTAVKRAENALMMLRSAALSERVAQDAIDIAGRFPEFSPARTLWMKAIQQLEISATNDVAMALHYVRQMRHYFRLQFFGAWMILFA